MVYNNMRMRFNSAREKAERKVNMEYKTSNNFNPAELGSAIDHVFYSKKGIVGQHFETIISEYGYRLSDHLPIFFDFTLE